MSTKPAPEMGTGLFGYRKSAVHQMIGDRDTMLRRANERVRQAEARAADLDSQLAGLAEQQGRKDEQIKRLRAQVEELSNRSTETEGRWQELQTEADGRRRQLETEIEERRRQVEAEADRQRRELETAAEGVRQKLEGRKQQVEAQAEQVAGWRTRLLTRARSVQKTVGDLQTATEELPGRVEQAFRPMTETIASMQQRIERLAEELKALGTKEPRGLPLHPEAPAPFLGR
ncbi:MAG TPA: hypothetical protein VKK30_01960 [Actinomycetota bacterium]|nr:hypothetical protein [Actinomycetota bacterium]